MNSPLLAVEGYEERPKAVDLCCGRGGVTRALLAAGYDVTGVDIIHHPDYPPAAKFIQSDAADIDGKDFVGTLFMWASPPCKEFSRFRMPWTRAKNPPEPDLSIVRHCYRIRSEAQVPYFILENVREAQRWLGKATLQREGRYLWGDIILAPKIKARTKESYPGNRADLRAEVPEELVYSIATMVKNGTQLLAHLGVQRG